MIHCRQVVVTCYRISPSRAGRLFPLVQDAEHIVYNLRKGTGRRAVCVSNGERTAEGILDLDKESEI